MAATIGGATVYCVNAYLKSIPDQLAEQIKQFHEEEKEEFFNRITFQEAVGQEFPQFIAAFEETIPPIPSPEQIAAATTKSLSSAEKQQFWEDLKVISK